jgi:NAD(P)-dependent dehydrogenase (short-subunit alcohol dehydrogenase family)
MINPMDLTGKRILVTGASSGIGKETAIHLSKLGANVILVARNKDKLINTIFELEDVGHSLYSFDLKNISATEKFLEEIINKEGKLNGLVHCAGINELRPLGITGYDFLHNMMLINFYSFVELVRVISKKKNCAKNTSIVVMSSVSSVKGDKSKTAYCASKGAINSAVRAMAKELAIKNIRVNSVVAGFLKTNMYDSYIKELGEETFNENVLKHQYLGLGEPIDASNAIAFLLSNASKFITGTEFVVDGGYLS